MARFRDSRDSALEIIMSLVNKQPTVLQIQHELVDENKNLIDTAAGATVSEEIKRLEEEYSQKLAKVQAELAEASADRDQELQDALMEAKSSIERLHDDNRRAQDALQYERRNAQRRQENMIQSLQHELQHQKLMSERAKQEMKAELLWEK